MSHPGRRAMLRSARHEERTASELAAVAGLAPSAASPHLKMLRDAGLMHMRVDARRRLYRVDFERLAQVRQALSDLWDERLDDLKRLAETRDSARAPKKGRSA